jgi:hypothetical protein
MRTRPPQLVAGRQLAQQVQGFNQTAELMQNAGGRDLPDAERVRLAIVLAQPEHVPGFVLHGMTEAIPTG